MLTASPPPAETAKAPDRDHMKADLCILGGGPAGIALAANVAACGQKVVLIEKNRLGGCSQTYGTVPAASLLASAEASAVLRRAASFALDVRETSVDWLRLAARLRSSIAAMAPNVSPERLSGLGVTVIQAAGRFVGPRAVHAGEHRIEARRFVIATGSAPIVPDIKGIGETPVMSTDTVFENREPIDHLVVIGAGAAGTTLAQCYRRLGARVTLIDQSAMLSRFDPELAGVVRDGLAAEGVVIHESARIDAISGARRRLMVDGLYGGTRARIECTHVLIACGRRPIVNDLGLDLAKVTSTPVGIAVNAGLCTSNRRVYAIGDVTGHPYSVQRGEYHARQLAAAFITGRRIAETASLVPVALYTDPGLATVGLSEADARKVHGRIEVHRFAMRENVRALATGSSAGHIKVTTDRSGRILGAGVAAHAAAELIDVWSLAISRKMTLADMAGLYAPHPSFGEINRKAAVHRYAELAGHAAGRAWGRLLERLG